MKLKKIDNIPPCFAKVELYDTRQKGTFPGEWCNLLIKTKPGILLEESVFEVSRRKDDKKGKVITCAINPHKVEWAIIQHRCRSAFGGCRRSEWYETIRGVKAPSVDDYQVIVLDPANIAGGEV